MLNNKNEFTDEFIKNAYMKGKGRGPDHSVIRSVAKDCIFGFHRLAINGLSDISNQPIIIGNIALICNGEIYNYKKLYLMMGIEPKTKSDCEVIIHLYERYGIDHTLKMLDGVFALILCDFRTENDDTKIFVARDPLGVRPLYKLWKPLEKIHIFASEIKVLNDFHNKDQLNESNNQEQITHFEPGTYSEFTLPFIAISQWKLTKDCVVYWTPGSNANYESEYSTVLKNIRRHLSLAVEKRVLATERPIACLLSGGLDSSIITSLVNMYHKDASKPLETYSIGLENSVDLVYAKKVADFLGTHHTEIKLTEKDFMDAIPEVIYAIESYDTTTVRASIGNYLLGKYISRHSDAKVIFNGDGSDELTGGYKYMNCAPDAIEFDRECKRLLSEIHKYDVLRSDKCISSHGLEPRTPFLDKSFLQYYLGIDPILRFHPKQNKCEKYLIREAFVDKENPFLPEDVLFRRKEAFSDGVGNSQRTLFQIIPEYLQGVKTEVYRVYNDNEPKTQEQLYYRNLFEEYYPNVSNSSILPCFWSPKYIESHDPSARSWNI
jgi:asparagine synthase (glutamine-hydrolysing)